MEQHLYRVTMTIPDVEGQVTVQLPAWNGLYQIRDFAHRVSGFRAMDVRTKPLSVVKLDKQTWRIKGDGSITVQHAVYWDEPGPFSSQLNREHAFVNLATILFYVPERRNEDVRIMFVDLSPSWRVAVALDSSRRAEGSAVEAYVAANYDALVDAPVEIGPVEEFRIEGLEPPVRLAVHGDAQSGKSNREQITQTLRRIVSYQTQLMRGAPFREYLFIYHIGSAAGGAGGGMEHANSTAIFAESASSVASVTAHEFFHLWNVKRIRPQSLEPVDYTREQGTRALWFAEGVTSTYTAYTLVRTGLWSPKQFYDNLAAQIAELESRPARFWKSVEEASLDAWLGEYPLYRGPEPSISYYNKGQILGVLLDILIRDSTGNGASLDDLLRSLDETFARRSRSYRDTADIQAQAERIAGHNLEEFFSRYVAGTDELPCADLLGRAGLVLKTRVHLRADFGFVPTRGPDGSITATQITRGSSADRAGVREGDVLLELGGGPFPGNGVGWLRNHRPGEIIKLQLRRRDLEREVSFVLGEGQERTYEIEEAARATEVQRKIREGLLRGTTDPGQL